MEITNKKDIAIGMLVDILADKDKGTDNLTRGYVTKILSQANNKKGIKVRLNTGDEGHVSHIVSQEEVRLENFKFYNRFFFEKQLYSVWDKTTRSLLVFDYYNGNKGIEEKTALLFDTEAEAKAFIRGTAYDSKDYLIRPVQRRKMLVDIFASVGAEYFRINGTRKLSKDKLNEWEHYFRNMR